MDIFIRIKRLVVARHVVFTEKAETEMVADSLTPELVYESILNAPAIFKILRSRNPRTKTCHLADGVTIKRLRHYKCRACGARLFDDAAIHRIQQERAEHPAMASR